MIHIFNGFHNPNGGSEQEALRLYDMLRGKRDVQLWSTSSRTSAELAAAYPIRRVAPLKGDVPRGGTYVFVGAHWRNRLWPYFAGRPERLVYVFNTFHPKLLALTSTHPPLLRWPATELVLISAFQARLLGVTGEIQPSPIDIARFAPRAHATRAQPVIGRLSRDTADKHHPDDIAVYKTLVARGCKLLLQGATTLAGALPQDEAIRLLPEGAMPAPDFLHELDIFYYRTGEHVETFGRVVLEAMACGLPVVCHRHGGYADVIRHGENGYLFDTPQEALAMLDQLIVQPALRARIGDAARSTVEQLYSREALDARAAFYLRRAAR
ncbi:glycosyltransferase family 4 protein [Paraburkholderia sp. LEh10]|uniref:glycosyltransferase family 4 protein n=1 Tax=Paraburkholderia sp. LEh10 TaxID=2821353 RepID=UPI001AE32C15|nr:glycosyltransferase family 4 protein [Paraburkholderia sp. LEh10]MBP0591690.1 glycosyltransferase family 4 protein [Paraburkholderia sp. LEh10]